MPESLKIEKRALTDHEFNPKIIDMRNFIEGKFHKEGSLLEKRHVHFLEIEFFTYGGGGMYIDEDYVDVEAGYIVIRKPGQYTRATMPYACYYLAVDLAGRGERVYGKSPYLANTRFVPDYQHLLINDLPSVIKPKRPGLFKETVETLFDDYLNPSKLSPIKQKELILKLFLDLHSEVYGDGVSIQSAYKKMLEAVIKYITIHYAQQIKLEDLANVAGMSPSHFHKTFRKEMGRTPLDYLQRYRISIGKRLLVMEKSTILDVALGCGFDSATYFATVFGKHVGMTPKEYRLHNTKY